MVFSDLAGYTAMSERLDPEDVRAVTGEVFRIASETFGRFGGRIDKLLGDAVLAIFGDPVAHEDDAERAVRAVLELHGRVDALSDELADRVGCKIAIHSGVNTGIVITGEQQVPGADSGPTGDAVNVAARIEALSASREILIGPETRRLVEGLFELEDRGLHDLKGKTGAVPIFAVRRVAAGRGAREHAGAFIGRERELGLLRAAFEDLQTRTPSMWSLCGEAGSGKSRLCEELRRHVEADGGRWLEGRALSFAQSTPYAPIIDLLATTIGLTGQDPPEAVCETVTGWLAQHGLDTIEVAGPLRSLFGLPAIGDDTVVDAESFPLRLAAAVQMILRRLAVASPVVVCLQDLHWADPSSIELLGRVSPGGFPTMIVLNHRPELSLDIPGLRRLVVADLSTSDTIELVGSLLDTPEPPAHLVDLLVAQTEGNPFFVEELLHNLIESGQLQRRPTGWELTARLERASVPPTVRGVISARIDRLGESSRTLLREASVVGRQFLHSLISSVSAVPAPIEKPIGVLRTADLIRERGRSPELEYMFEHAVTQEVAYGTMSRSTRQRIHRKTARAIEELFAERRADFIDLLAHHHAEAGDVEQAVQSLTEAGLRSAGHYAVDEANTSFRRAYELLVGKAQVKGGRVEDGRALVNLLNGWAQVFYYQGRIGEWVRLLEQHLDIAEGVGDPDMLSMYLGWLGNGRWFHGDNAGSLAALDRAIEIGRTAGNGPGVRHAEAWRLHTLIFMGRAPEAVAAAAKIHYRPQDVNDNPYPMYKGRMASAIGAAIAGDGPAAARHIAELIEFGRQASSPRAEAAGCVCEAAWRWMILDFEGAYEAAKRGLEVSRDEVYAASNAFSMALALLATRRYEDARAFADSWQTRVDDAENYWIGAGIRGLGAAADVALGRMTHGMRRLEQIVDDLGRRDYVFLEYSFRLAIAQIHVTTARRDVDVAVRSLLKYPRFVATHAIPAGRKAARELEFLRATVPGKGLEGFVPQIEYFDALLHSKLKQRDRAAKSVDTATAFLRRVGADPNPPALVLLRTELGLAAEAPGRG